MKRPCVYTDIMNHSDDVLAVYHGCLDGKPTYICGFHEQSRGIPQGADRVMLDRQHQEQQ